MSRDGSCELVWAGDERRFRLGLDELFALQDKCDAGPAEIASRLRNGTWRLQDIQEVFRLSLIGGGEEAKKAKSLVAEHIVPGKLQSNVLIAFAILLSALQGDENDPVGKDQAEAPASEATASSPRPSTETAQ
jgi:Phage tail tube protein, GTA-gp10